MVGPIQLRDALKGGRTNNIKFLHETTDEESIRYLDVCSLYPAQLKRQKYPLGHPEKITDSFDMTLQSYFGYVQCAVDPPAKLRFGVLPLTVNGKLKLAQRNNLSTTDIVTNQLEMRKILLDPDKIVDSLYCPTENHMIINWRWGCDEQSRVGVTNLAVAGFVTAYGRVTLLRHMENVERVRVGRVLYFDTDSVIFVERSGDPEVPTGSFLGDLTDEIPSWWKCDTFACGGPKNYLLGIRKGDETKIILRAKGLVLTSEASQIVNIDSMVDMCRKFIQGEVVLLLTPMRSTMTTWMSL